MITVRGILALTASLSATLTRTFTEAFRDLALILGDSKGRVTDETNTGTNKETPPNVPVPCAFKPVEDVCASGVVYLVKRVSVGLLDSHSVAKRQKCEDTGGGKKYCTILRQFYFT